MSEIFAHDELAFLLLLPPGYLVLQFWSQSRRRATSSRAGSTGSSRSCPGSSTIP